MRRRDPGWREGEEAWGWAGVEEPDGKRAVGVEEAGGAASGEAAAKRGVAAGGCRQSFFFIFWKNILSHLGIPTGIKMGGGSRETKGPPFVSIILS